MHITQCIAAKTGLLDNCVLDLDAGCNVIFGPNDSGKSLLSRALVDSVFSPLSGSYFLPDEMWSNFYLNATISGAEGNWRFAKNGPHDLTVSLVGEKDARDVYRSGDGGNIGQIFKSDESLSTTEIWHLMRKLDTRAFLDTGYVTSPFESHITSHFSPETIRSIILCDQSGFAETTKSFCGVFSNDELSDRINDPLTADILNHESELRKISKELQILELHSSKIIKLTEEKLAIEKQNDEAAQNLEGLTAKRERYNEAQKNLASMFIADSKIKGLKLNISEEEEKRKHLQNFRGEIDARYPNFVALNESQRDNLGKIQSAYREAIDCRDAHEKRKRFLTALSAAVYSGCVFASVIALATPIAAHLALPDLFGANPMLKFAPLAIIPLGVLPAVAAFRRKLKFDAVHSLEKNLLDKEHELGEILEKSEIRPSYNKFEELFEFLLQYFEEYAEYLDLENEHDSLSEMLASPQRLDELKVEIAQLEEKRIEMLNAVAQNLDKDEKDIASISVGKIIEEIDAKIAQTNAELERNAEILDQIRDEINSRASENSVVTSLLDKKAFHHEKLEALKKKSRQAKFIARTMKDAQQSRVDAILAKLTNEVSDVFGELMGSRPAEDFSAFIKGDTGVIKNPSIRIIAVLSMKLALTDILSSCGIKIPLFIDEPAAYMDKNRIRNFNDIIGRFKEKRQIIILTCDENAFAETGRIVKM